MCLSFTNPCRDSIQMRWKRSRCLVANLFRILLPNIIRIGSFIEDMTKWLPFLLFRTPCSSQSSSSSSSSEFIWTGLNSAEGAAWLPSRCRKRPLHVWRSSGSVRSMPSNTRSRFTNSSQVSFGLPGAFCAKILRSLTLTIQYLVVMLTAWLASGKIHQQTEMNEILLTVIIAAVILSARHL